MKNIRYTIHPFNRILFLLFSIVGIIIIDELFYLTGFYVLIIVPLVLLLRLGSIHYRLLLFGIAPIFLTLILIYIIVLQGNNDAWVFVFTKCIKILNITSVFQIALTIPSHMLFQTFKKWGIKREKLQTLIGTFTVWADIKARANQIVIARFARGFIGKRNFINTAKQFPYVLIPLIIGVLRTATERVEVWNQRDVPGLIDNIKVTETKYPFIFNLLLFVTPLIMIAIGIYIRII